jgi:hypothetical protein
MGGLLGEGQNTHLLRNLAIGAVAPGAAIRGARWMGAPGVPMSGAMSRAFRQFNPIQSKITNPGLMGVGALGMIGLKEYHLNPTVAPELEKAKNMRTEFKNAIPELQKLQQTDIYNQLTGGQKIVNDKGELDFNAIKDLKQKGVQGYQDYSKALEGLKKSDEYQYLEKEISPWLEKNGYGKLFLPGGVPNPQVLKNFPQFASLFTQENTGMTPQQLFGMLQQGKGFLNGVGGAGGGGGMLGGLGGMVGGLMGKFKDWGSRLFGAGGGSGAAGGGAGNPAPAANPRADAWNNNDLLDLAISSHTNNSPSVLNALKGTPFEGMSLQDLLAERQRRAASKP